MLFEIAVKGEGIPATIEPEAIDRETDTREILADDDLKGSQTLIVDEIDVLVVAGTAEGDDAEDIAEIDLVPGQEVDIEGQIEILCEAKGVFGRKVEGGPFFLHHFMTAKGQTIGLGEIACSYQ